MGRLEGGEFKFHGKETGLRQAVILCRDKHTECTVSC